MPLVTSKRVWTQQPQVALPLNTGSSLTNGLIFATDSTGRDVISGVMPKFLGSGKRSLKKEGYTLESPDTSSSGIYWELPADHPLYSIGTQDTTFVKANISAKVEYGAFIGVPYRSGAWASPYFAWGFILGADAVSAYHWTGSDHFYTRVLSSYFNTVGTTISYCASRDGLTAYFYKDNALIGSGYNSDSSAPSFTNKQPLCLFNQSNTASGAVLNAYAPEIRVYNRVLSEIERAALHENPQIIFRPDGRRIWVPSAGGGGITITCSPGNATTAGITAGISSATTIACTPGGASTAGVACALPIKIACNVGNATPTGIACSLQVVVQCNAGTATTAGVSAGIALDSSITISCNAGTATTNGVSASFPQTLSCTPGNATTAGNSATFPRSLSCNVGNATTAGITAQVDIAGQIVIGCNAGTATTAGIQASVSSAIVLACNAGTATTLGATAYFPQSLQCSPGNAIALGIDATFTLTGPTTIVCNVGNATASGISFSFGGTLVDAPNGSGPAIIIPRGTRQPNIGGIRI